MSEKIPQAVIRRLPRYYRYLEEMLAKGEDKISSSKMSADMGLNASQIRRDLNCFGGFGQQGYGYSVAKLKSEIAHILGLDRTYKVIVVGAGRIGQALMGYTNFIKEGFNIIDIFDADPSKVGMTVEYKSVRHTSDLPEYLKPATRPTDH
jgi:redox-sensing transcriptional repressor